jgi:hypothetical protein
LARNTGLALDRSSDGSKELLPVRFEQSSGGLQLANDDIRRSKRVWSTEQLLFLEQAINCTIDLLTLIRGKLESARYGPDEVVAPHCPRSFLCRSCEQRALDNLLSEL